MTRKSLPEFHAGDDEVRPAGDFAFQQFGLLPGGTSDLDRPDSFGQQPRDFGGALPGHHGVQVRLQQNVGAASRHVGGHSHGAEGPGLANDGSLGMGGDCVQYPVRHPPVSEQAADLPGLLHGAGAHQHRLAREVTGIHLVNHRRQLVFPRLVHHREGGWRASAVCTGETATTSSPYLRRNSPAAVAAVPVMPARCR